MIKFAAFILVEQHSIIYSLSIAEGGEGKEEIKTHRQEFTTKGRIRYDRMKNTSYKPDLL